MDAERARNMARMVGLGVVLVAVWALMFMQRQLLKLRRESETGGTRFILADDETPEAAVRKVLGEAGSIVGGRDIDYDGLPEVLAEVGSGSAPTRVAVLSPRGGRRFAVVFDSDHPPAPAGADPPPPSASPPPDTRLRVHILTPSHVDLEPVDASGRPAGPRIEAMWSAQLDRFARVLRTPPPSPAGAPSPEAPERP